MLLQRLHSSSSALFCPTRSRPAAHAHGSAKLVVELIGRGEATNNLFKGLILIHSDGPPAILHNRVKLANGAKAHDAKLTTIVLCTILGYQGSGHWSTWSAVRPLIVAGGVWRMT